MVLQEDGARVIGTAERTETWCCRERLVKGPAKVVVVVVLALAVMVLLAREQNLELAVGCFPQKQHEKGPATGLQSLSCIHS